VRLFCPQTSDHRSRQRQRLRLGRQQLGLWMKTPAHLVDSSQAPRVLRVAAPLHPPQGLPLRREPTCRLMPLRLLRLTRLPQALLTCQTQLLPPALMCPLPALTVPLRHRLQLPLPQVLLLHLLPC
jgi:hypothetical protein